MLDGINYWDELKDSPSQMDIWFAVFANVLELDDQGEPTDEKYAERRAVQSPTVLPSGRCALGRAPI